MELSHVSFVGTAAVRAGALKALSAARFDAARARRIREHSTVLASAPSLAQRQA
jgi:hypothetical protein